MNGQEANDVIVGPIRGRMPSYTHAKLYSWPYVNYFTPSVDSDSADDNTLGHWDMALT